MRVKDHRSMVASYKQYAKQISLLNLDVQPRSWESSEMLSVFNFLFSQNNLWDMQIGVIIGVMVGTFTRCDDICGKRACYGYSLGSGLSYPSLRNRTFESIFIPFEAGPTTAKSKNYVYR